MWPLDLGLLLEQALPGPTGRVPWATFSLSLSCWEPGTILGTADRRFLGCADILRSCWKKLQVARILVRPNPGVGVTDVKVGFSSLQAWQMAVVSLCRHVQLSSSSGLPLEGVRNGRAYRLPIEVWATLFVENLLWLSWSMTFCPVGALALSKL